MTCARRVFRCFRCIEHAADRITGAAGPWFVCLAISLLSTGILSFFIVIQPTLPFPWLTTPLCILIALNVVGHYYHACTVPPGFVSDTGPPVHGSGFLWAALPPHGGSHLNIVHARMSRCRKCHDTRPERAHHCRVCNHCVLKFDHHCPVRINQCVGLYNERHFVLFMAYLVLATSIFTVLGFPHVLIAFEYTLVAWNHRVPSFLFITTYVLCLVLSFAVTIMLTWHLWGVARGETAVEAQDHQVYAKWAKERGEAFINSYDLGARRNIALFFNVGEGGYPLYTLFLPFRLMPYTDGYAWAHREGLNRHHGVREGEELTDGEDDEDYGGETGGDNHNR
ncbi:zf-DHHC-domain-containing protein [Pisolithus marmoratus]|nr:zf-DHHC-domain-containing protein [Pisolithus marmoratus]